MEKCNPDWPWAAYLDDVDTNDTLALEKYCNIEKSDFEEGKFSLNYLIKNVYSYSEVNSLLSVQSENYTDNKNQNISKQQQQEVDFTVNGTSYFDSSDMYTHSVSEIKGTSEQEPMKISHNSSSGTKIVEISSPQCGITGKGISGSGADFSTTILSSSISGGKNEIVPSLVFNFASVPTVCSNMSPSNSSITSSIDGNGYSIPATKQLLVSGDTSSYTGSILPSVGRSGYEFPIVHPASDDTPTSKSLVLPSINTDENKVTEEEQIKMNRKRSRNNESSKRTRRKKKRYYEEIGEENRKLKEKAKEMQEQIISLQQVKDDLVNGIAITEYDKLKKAFNVEDKEKRLLEGKKNLTAIYQVYGKRNSKGILLRLMSLDKLLKHN